MVKVNLYPHQRKALDKLHSGSILCGDVGTGKSRAAIAYFYTSELGASIEEDGWFTTPTKSKDLYIITTARKRDSLEWDKELTAFYLSQNINASQCRIKIVIDSWNNIKKYQDVENSFFIFDEQRVVGYGAWVKSFLKISKSNNWILLSATPGDTWMDYMPVFVANGFFKNKTDFTRKHVVYDRVARYPKINRYVDTDVLEKLRQSILVEMPMKKSTNRTYNILRSSYDVDLYKKTFKDRWNPYTSEPFIGASDLCYTLRRIVNSDISRMDLLEDLLKDHDRMIIFYNYDYELLILREVADRIGITYSEYNGHKHEDIPKTDRWFYLVQYTAGAEGWNCVETDTIVFYSLNYSYKIMAQASGRIDRLNTEYKDLHYYAFSSVAPIDSAIIRCLKSKKNFNEKGFIEG